MDSLNKIFPIYTTRGDVGAFLIYPHVYNLNGEWIGWVTPDRNVYSVHGQYAGYMTNDPRILRKVSEGFDKPRRSPPARPTSIRVPATVPLAPMMSELTQGLIDVLDDDPDLLPPVDYGELREDMD
jgi:hypothetical protein